MAIQFARIEIVSRSSGGNSCCKGAYNARGKILDARSNITYNFSNRGDNVYHEVLLPEHADKKFVDISVLMNEIEKCERRKDSQLLKDAVIALPDDKELNLNDRIEITKRIIEKRGWVKGGLAVQIDIHQPHDGEKNWHAHLLITTRRFNSDGQSFGMKARDLNPEFKNTGEKTFIVPEEILLQHDTRDVINDYFKELGLENRVDMIRSIPQEHIGPVRMRSHLNEASLRNEERRLADLELLKTGEDVLARVTREMSVFSSKDLNRAVKVLPDETRAKELVKDALISREVIPLFNEDGKSAGLYTTHEVRQEEAKLMRLGDYVNRQDNLLYKASPKEAIRCYPVSKTQGKALDYLLSYPTGLKVLKGRAGTGKSFVLGVVAKVAKGAGIETIGLAPTHKAKLELQSSGYEKCDTVKGFLFKLHNNRVELPKNSLIVVDEAAMVGNSDYSELMRVAADKKCNVILAGDERQLSSISKGGMFEVYADYFGSSEMSEIRRQEQGWSREVASSFSKGDVREGIEILKSNDRILENFNKGDSIITLVCDWSKSSVPLKDRLILAVKNTDVDAINKEARDKLIETGYLKGKQCYISWDDSRKGIGYLSGDRIVFQETNQRVGVNNGDFGTIKHADNSIFKVELDRGETVSFDPDQFYMFKHGYASTVYKAQGATISDVYVLHDGFSTLKNSYVAMSRHVNDLHLYTNLNATKDEWSLVQQLQFNPEKRASINYHTQDDFNKQTQGLRAHQNFLYKVITHAYDFIHEKVTEFMDKKTVNHEYYKSSFALASDTNTSRELNDFLEFHRDKLADMTKLNPKYDIGALRSTLEPLDKKEREIYIESSWLKTFKDVVLPELEDINKRMLGAKTVDGLAKVLAREKEFCLKMYDEHWRLSVNLEYQEKNDHITRINALYHNKPDLLESFIRDAHNISKFGIWDQNRTMNEIDRAKSIVEASESLFTLCQNHVIKGVDRDLNHLKQYGSLEYEGMKFDNAKSYLEHRMDDHHSNDYLKNSKVAAQLQSIHTQEKQLEQQKQLELEHPMKSMGMHL